MTLKFNRKVLNKHQLNEVLNINIGKRNCGMSPKGIKSLI